MIKNIPKDCIVTYTRIVVYNLPHKSDPNLVRITADGNFIEYPNELTARTVDLKATKNMRNRVISIQGAKYKCLDINNMYLATLMSRFEFMWNPLSLIPEEFVIKYNWFPLVKNGYIYTQIERGMYRLPQAVILVNTLLKKRLEPHGYYEVQHTPRLWRLKIKPLQFTLVVDKFGVIYPNEEDMTHLIDALQKQEKISTDHNGIHYYNDTLFWNYKEGYLEISIPGYVRKNSSSANINHHTAKTVPWQQYLNLSVNQTNALLNPIILRSSIPTKKLHWSHCGIFPFLWPRSWPNDHPCPEWYQQSVSKTDSIHTKKNTQFLDYMHTHPNAKIRYYPSDLFVNIHLDASYLCNSKA